MLIRSIPAKIIIPPTFSKIDKLCRLVKTMSTTSASSNDIAIADQGSLIDILKKNPKRYQRIQFLADLFKSGGYELRIAGGAVRDILRGKNPQDIDFATTARPEQSLELVSKHEDKFRIITTTAGQRHGTVAVKFKEVDQKKMKLDKGDSDDKHEGATKSEKKPLYDDEYPFEITTLRCDTVTDGRHAEVQFVNDWKTDAERRDLTINAMFLTLDTGTLVDYFGGESDLREGIVRFVGDADKRLKEDYLRILRFFRFWSRYGRKNQPDSLTEETLKKNMNGLDNISGERILIEIKKIFSHPPHHDVVELMFKMGLHHHIGVSEDMTNQEEYISRALEELKVVETNIANFRKLGESMQKQLDKKILDLLPMLLLSTLIRSPEALDSAHKRMKFSNLERDTMRYIIDSRIITPSLQTMKKQLATVAGPERPNTLFKMIAFNIFRGEFDLIKELSDWEVPLFPVQGNEVSRRIQLLKLPVNQTKVMISHLKDVWADSGFEMSKLELIEELERKLDELKNKDFQG